MDKFDIYLFETNYKDGQCCIDTEAGTVSMFEWDDQYSVQFDPLEPDMVCTLKRYFHDTLELKEEGSFLKWGYTKIGVWKKYIPGGTVIEETDYDQGWDITWEKLVPRILGQGIPLEGIVEISREEKRKDESDPESEVERIWTIGQITRSGEVIPFRFDGNTGKLIKEEQG